MLVVCPDEFTIGSLLRQGGVKSVAKHSSDQRCKTTVVQKLPEAAFAASELFEVAEQYRKHGKWFKIREA